MAKMKGTFGVKVSSGNSAGFSNIPGASSYTYKMGKQFADKFEKSYRDKKKKAGSPPPPQSTTEPPPGEPKPTSTPPKNGTTPQKETKSEPTFVKSERVLPEPKAIGAPATRQLGAPERLAIEPPKQISGPTTSPAMAESKATERARGGQLGGFKVNSGTGQVKTTTRQLTMADIQDPNSPSKRPIEPSNIPESYKPQGDRPSSRTWSEADKEALEAERPGATTVAKQRKMEKDAPISASSPKPPRTTPASVKKSTSKSQQFSGTSDTSNQPPVNLENL